MQKIILIIIIFFHIIIHKVVLSQPIDTNYYLFVGHLYRSPDKVDIRIENLDLTKYKGVWLGGDVCGELVNKISTLHYIDSLFNLSNPLTFWALGNHDARNANWEWIKQFTKRETFFNQTFDNTVSIVLNPNILPDNCFMLDKQFEMIKNVCDTIKNSTNLIIISHHCLWEGVPGVPSPIYYAHRFIPYWNSNCNDVNSTFVNSIYPILVSVKNRDINVINVFGDMGLWYPKKIEYVSDDGIYFLGCGLSNNAHPQTDYVLIFKTVPFEKKLFWEFKLLNSLKSKK